MAAAALASSSGVTVSSATKSLFLMFTLLSLVCLSTSLTNKNQLELLRETYRETQQQIEVLKAEYEEEVTSIKEMMNECINLMDPVIVLVKEKMQASRDDDFPAQDKFMEGVKNYMMKTQAYIDMKHEKFGGKIEENEKKLKKTKKSIEFLEDLEAYL